MTKSYTARVAIGACFLTLGAGLGQAQGTQTALPDPVPGTLAGIVVDSVNTPVRNIAVYVYELRRQVRTGVDGRFRFDSVSKGTYTLAARAAGFTGVTERIQVKAQGAVIRLRITRLEANLPAVITTATRAGLSGIVADTGLRALKDVEVKLLGTSLNARSDSAGRFYLAARPGSYLLRVERDGYARQLIGVTIPSSEGRELAIWMSRQTRGANPTVSANLFDFEQRRIRARAVQYASYSREDLMATGADDLMQAAARITVQRPSYGTCAYLDGGPATAPLWSLSVGDVEFMEAVIPGAPGREAGDIMGRTTGARSPCSYNVWLRQ